MSKGAESRPERAWLREFKDIHGWEILQQYNAHAVGIGWKKVADQKTDQLALIVYVERKIPTDKLTTECIPSSIMFTPTNSDQPVLLKTDVVEATPAELE